MLFRLTATRAFEKDREMEIPMTCEQIASWLNGTPLARVTKHLTDEQWDFLRSGALPDDLSAVLEAMNQRAPISSATTLHMLAPGDVFTVMGNPDAKFIVIQRLDGMVRVANQDFEVSSRLACEPVFLVEKKSVRVNHSEGASTATAR